MRRLAAYAFVLLTLACGGGDPAGPGGIGGDLNFTAKIDGANWNPEFTVTAVNPTPGLYSIAGFRSTGSSNYTLVLQLFNIPGTGTYPLGVGVQVMGGTAQLSQAPSSGWGTPLSGAAGEVVITTLTATRIAGTFSFVATPIMGSAVNKTVTQGAFDIPVSGTGGFAAANQGSTITGSLGPPFVASAAITTLNSGTLTVVGSTLTRNITISLASVTTAATYTLSASAPIRSITVGDGIGAVWRSDITGGSGSVMITSLTADRIVGTFTATVIGFSGGASGPLSVSGAFNLGRG